MKVIIAGSRKFKDYNHLKEKCDIFLQNQSDIEIVSGAQVTVDADTGEKYGADYLGEQYANDKGYNLHRMPADWKKYGKTAGPIRNRQMAACANALIAFWDGKSSGTKNMIDVASKLGLKVRVVLINL